MFYHDGHIYGQTGNPDHLIREDALARAHMEQNRNGDGGASSAVRRE